jgi:predicted metalloprotease
MHLRRLTRIGVVLLAAIALVLPSASTAFAKPLALQSDTSTDSTDSGSTAVVGNSYTSPAFGYSITWNRDWSVSDEQNQSDYNKLVLSNDVSTVYIEGVSDPSTPDECVTQIAAGIGQQTGVTNVKKSRTAADPLDGQDIADRSWAVYDFTYTPDTGDALELSEYIDCRPVETGKSLAVITALIPTSDYDSQLDPLATLLGGFAIDGSTGPSPDNTPTSDSGTSGNSGNTSASESQIENFVQISAKDIDGFWTREFPLISGGKAYTPPAGVVPFTKSVDTKGCGSADVGGGPFYCPSDRTVYYDIPYAEQQIQNLGSESAIAVAIAHEIGHHIQNLMQWKECTETPCLDPTEMTSQEIELQADCFAGAWTADAETRGRLGGFDVETNIVQFAVFLGDPTGNVADPGAHGKGARRVYSFLTGYYDGIEACLKISAASDPARNGGANANSNSTDNGNADNGSTTDNGNNGNNNGQVEATATPSNANGASDLIQMGDDYTIDLKDSSLAMNVGSTDTQQSIDAGPGFEADGTYLIVYFSVKRDAATAGPFPYASFVVTDGDGNEYRYSAEVTDAVLKTSDTLPDGTDQALDADSTYNLAIIFDVPADASGFTFSTSSGDFPVQLDK